MAQDQLPELLTELVEGMPLLYGGDGVVRVSAELAAAFVPGDKLVVVAAGDGEHGTILHLPGAVADLAADAVRAAAAAFEQMGTITDQQISDFYAAFARRLVDDETFAPIAAANAADVVAAAGRGRSTTRLELSARMRADMIAGLETWRDAASTRGLVVDTIEHEGWRIEQVRSGLGVVGFVFEGRPNVFADATGVLRSGNTVVFRIGSDALGTARAIVEHALDPALAETGLPAGAVGLIASPAHAAGWAMFNDARVSLAVARGSGAAVAQLGAVARQAGVPVSLHGTGGAWIVAAPDADAHRFRGAVLNSLDRKVCNTLNTCCIEVSRVHDLLPVFLEAVEAAGVARGAPAKLHIVAEQADLLPREWFEPVGVERAEGVVVEPRTSTLDWDELGHEWEWENSPEVTLAIVQSVDEAVDRFNATSPQFVASLVSEDSDAHQRFFDRINAPFVGNGFTRWVDGQYALCQPELGLSNWQFGRLFGRGGVLSGDSVFTIRSRVWQSEPDLRR